MRTETGRGGGPRFQAIAALRHRNFRLLWFGQLVSSMGDQMQIIAISWHLYQITDSTVALGLLALCRLVPFISLSLVGGALADTLDRRRLMMATQSLQMGVAIYLATATGLGIDSPWVIYVASVLGGAFMAFDGPARQAMVPNLVPRDELTNALTLNALIRQTATIVGPGLGGLAIAAIGVPATFGINAVTFLAVLGGLLAMRGVRVVTPSRGSSLERIAGGLRFARSEPLVLLPLLLDFITRALGSPRGLLPVFARDIFQAGPEGLGLLGSAAAVGAVAGGVALGSFKHVPRPMVLMLAAYVGESLLNAGFAVSPNLAIAWLALALGGVCNVTGELMFTTIGQLRTPNELRGRTSALTNIFSSGGPSTGTLEIGFLASIAGPVNASVLNGLAGAAVATGFGFLPGLRRWIGARDMRELAVEEGQEEQVRT